jgi:hypothetical protein
MALAQALPGPVHHRKRALLRTRDLALYGGVTLLHRNFYEIIVSDGVFSMEGTIVPLGGIGGVVALEKGDGRGAVPGEPGNAELRAAVGDSLLRS